MSDRGVHDPDRVYASIAVADGRGSFGYVIYVKPEDYERAAAPLGM